MSHNALPCFAGGRPLRRLYQWAVCPCRPQVPRSYMQMRIDSKLLKQHEQPRRAWSTLLMTFGQQRLIIFELFMTSAFSTGLWKGSSARLATPGDGNPTEEVDYKEGCQASQRDTYYGFQLSHDPVLSSWSWTHGALNHPRLAPPVPDPRPIKMIIPMGPNRREGEKTHQLFSNSIVFVLCDPRVTLYSIGGCDMVATGD